MQHRALLVPLLQAVTRTRSTAQWIALLEHQAVPCGPINDLRQAFDDAQVQARGLVVNQPLARTFAHDAAIESIASVASPLRLLATPPVLQRPPPALGEHTEEVLTALGLDAQRIAALRQAGVV